MDSFFTMGSESPTMLLLFLLGFWQPAPEWLPPLTNIHLTYSESESPYWAALTSGDCLSHSAWALIPHAGSPVCWNVNFTSLGCLYLLLLSSFCGLTPCIGTSLTLFEFWHLISNNNPLLGYSHLPLCSGYLMSSFVPPQLPQPSPYCYGQLPCPALANGFKSELLKKRREEEQE